MVKVPLERGLEFVVDPLELAFKFVFGFESLNVSGLWKGEEV